jgi:hypothetical protein
MSTQQDSPPPDSPDQVARAKRLREEIAQMERHEAVPKSPRAFTDRAAAEAARKHREESE